MRSCIKKISILFLGLLIGCNDTSQVQNGIMTSNPSITVGDAFNNWDACEKTKWDEFTTDNNMRIVEFSCMDIIKAQVMDELADKYVGMENERREGELKIAYYKYVFQWVINVDGSFEIDNVQQVIVWRDGKKFEDTLDADEQVNLVYQNSVFSVQQFEKDSGGEGFAQIIFHRLWATFKHLHQIAK